VDRPDIITNVTYFCPICKCKWTSPEKALACRDQHAEGKVVKSCFNKDQSIPATVKIEFPGGYRLEYSTYDPYRSHKAYQERLAKEKAAHESGQ
jgi:hypothetical protein